MKLFKVRRYRQLFILPALLCALSLLLILNEPHSGELLQYNRGALASAQLWRLFTAHVVHLSWTHLWLNMAVLALAWVLVGHFQSNKQWLMLLLICAVGISAGLWFFSPSIQWYVGLSGLIHGILAAGALAGFMQDGRHREEIILLVIVAIKLAWEQYAAPIAGTSDIIGGKVIVDAHLYGAMSGVLFVLFRHIWNKQLI